MTTSTLRVFTQITARPGQETELRNVLRQLAEQRQQRTGCSRCELLQHSIHSTEFILLEEWELAARLESEFNTEALEKLLEEGAAFIAEQPSINWYEVV